MGLNRRRSRRSARGSPGSRRAQQCPSGSFLNSSRCRLHRLERDGACRTHSDAHAASRTPVLLHHVPLGARVSPSWHGHDGATWADPSRRAAGRTVAQVCVDVCCEHASPSLSSSRQRFVGRALKRAPEPVQHPLRRARRSEEVYPLGYHRASASVGRWASAVIDCVRAQRVRGSRGGGDAGPTATA